MMNGPFSSPRIVVMEKQMSIQAIIFDLDNTLYPASSGVMAQIDQRIGEYVRQRLGVGEEEALLIRRTYCETFGTTLRGLLHHRTDVHTDEYLEFVHNIEIEALLRFDAELDAALAALNVPKIIFTNAPREHAERVLKAMGLAHHFERIFDLRHFNFVGKPDPAAYQHVLEYLGVPGTAALMLEDSAYNLPPAKALGMTTMLVGELLPKHPDADYHVPHILAALDVAQVLVGSPTHVPVGAGNGVAAHGVLRKDA
jgi:putative hydrolase of the HAD superfamily